jgi:hypothetical protein
MALVIRYRCHTCGAHVAAQGRSAWVRCSYCRALVGYDWQAWFESPEYLEWLKSLQRLWRGREAAREDRCHSARLHPR